MRRLAPGWIGFIAALGLHGGILAAALFAFAKHPSPPPPATVPLNLAMFAPPAVTPPPVATEATPEAPSPPTPATPPAPAEPETTPTEPRMPTPTPAELNESAPAPAMSESRPEPTPNPEPKPEPTPPSPKPQPKPPVKTRPVHPPTPPHERPIPHAMEHHAPTSPTPDAPAKTTEPHATPSPPTASLSPSSTEPAAAPAPSQQPTAPSPTEKTDQLAAYQAALMTAIAEKKFYPPLAQRLGQEGSVMVALTVEADGRLTDIHLVGTPDSVLLGRGALEAVESLGRFRPLPPALGLSRMPVQVTLVYKLR